MNKLQIGIIIIGVAVAISIAATVGLLSDMNMTMEEPAMDMDSELTGTVTIGLLMPLTGDLSSQGEQRRIAAELAVDDFNNYLQEKGSSWNLASVVEDTQTNPVIALEKTTTLNARDINVVIGPATSANIRNMIGYLNNNNMLAISCCSTAPGLAIEGDNVFRMVPDDNNQGPKISSLFLDNGIDVMIPVWRAEAWGDGLRDATVNAFSEAGGIVDEGIRYNPEAPEFSASASLLAQRVQEYVDEHGADKVAILTISFAEILQLMHSASSHDILDDIMWFGSDGTTNEQRLIDDPIGAEFSEKVNYTTVQFAQADNSVTEHVKDHIMAEFGRLPDVYSYTSYDAVWVAGLAIDAAQSTDTDKIKENIIPVAADHIGAVGSTALNPAGDLDSKDYALWTIQDGAWVVIE